MRVAPDAAQALLAKYQIHRPVTDERYLSHADVTRGVRLHVVCVSDAELGKRIVVSSARERWTRKCPLSPQDARALVREMADDGALPHVWHELETLVHLLVRCSQLFVNERLLRFRLAPVYVGQNDYRIGSAAMASTSRVAPHKRLEPHAHDQGAVFAHRPTVRLRK